MRVKGFIIEDDHGKELVLECQGPMERMGKTFLLSGWQRRRLVPLHPTPEESDEILAGVLRTLKALSISFH